MSTEPYDADQPLSYGSRGAPQHGDQFRPCVASAASSECAPACAARGHGETEEDNGSTDNMAILPQYRM